MKRSYLDVTLGTSRLVALEEVWRRGLFLDYLCNISRSAMNTYYYFGKKHLKIEKKKCAFLIIDPPIH